MTMKPGVTLDNVQGIAIQAMFKLDELFNELGYPLVITSTTDGKHMVGSLHYVGLAFDLRIRHMPEDVIKDVKLKIVKTLKLLSTRFQVVLEKTHIHVEYDRRIN